MSGTAMWWEEREGAACAGRAKARDFFDLLAAQRAETAAAKAEAAELRRKYSSLLAADAQLASERTSARTVLADDALEWQRRCLVAQRAVQSLTAELLEARSSAEQLATENAQLKDAVDRLSRESARRSL